MSTPSRSNLASRRECGDVSRWMAGLLAAAERCLIYHNMLGWFRVKYYAYAIHVLSSTSSIYTPTTS